jgi:hypothetical protein
VSSPEATTDPGVGDRSGQPDRATARQALFVVLAITAIAALILIEFAFSTANDASSINGRTATSSHYLDGT